MSRWPPAANTTTAKAISCGPTVLLSDDPSDESFSTEYFGPILSVHVYPDSDYEQILDVVDSGSKYALTGAVIADDRDAVLRAEKRLRLRSGELLRQRQAHRRSRRPTAIRWLPGVGHQRQGRFAIQPSALDIRKVDQGDVRPGRPTTTIRIWRRDDGVFD